MRSNLKSSNQVRRKLSEALPNIWRFALSLSGNPDTADDLTQSTCLRAIEKADQFQTNNNFTGWLLVICRSIWLNELRANSIRRTGGLETASANDLIDIKANTERNVFALQVYEKILDLPEAQRTTVELVYVQEFTYSEAARILDVPIGTVMSRLSTARKSLSTLETPALYNNLTGKRS